MTEENHISYELMIVVDPSLGDERTHEEVEKIKESITELEGKVTNEDFWGVRYLSYKIKRHDKGFYVVLNFNVAPAGIKEILKDIRLNPAVLRNLLIKTPRNYEVKSLAELEKEAEKYKKQKKEKGEEKESAKEIVVEEPKPIRRKPSKIEEKEEVKEIKEVKEKPRKEVEKIEEKIEEKVEEKVKKEPEEEPKEKTPEPKKAEPKEKPSIKFDTSDLDDVDAKLKSIIDDPDISL